MMTQHFVTFYSPGTFVSETTTKPIAKWDVATAKRMARKITERFNASPYAFQFSTRTRRKDELDSREVKRSGMYYLGGVVETLADVERRATKDDDILLSNMRINKYDRIITNTNSYRITLPLEKDDVVLDWK
jgi:hypothetical protein